MPVVGQIVDPVDRKSINFLYYNEIQDDGGVAEYQDQIIRGRSEDYHFYNNTSSNQYSFEIKLVSSVDEGDQGDAKKIWYDYLFIKSFQYPEYRTGIMIPPRQAQIVLGSWFNKRGLIVQPSATFSTVIDEDGYPYFIDVRFSFKAINEEPRDLFAIRQGNF